MSENYDMQILSSKSKAQAIKIAKSMWVEDQVRRNSRFFDNPHSFYFGQEPINRTEFWKKYDIYVNPVFIRKINSYLLEGGENNYDARVEALKWTLEKYPMQNIDIIDRVTPIITKIYQEENKRSKFIKARDKLLEKMKIDEEMQGDLKKHKFDILPFLKNLTFGQDIKSIMRQIKEEVDQDPKYNIENEEMREYEFLIKSFMKNADRISINENSDFPPDHLNENLDVVFTHLSKDLGKFMDDILENSRIMVSSMEELEYDNVSIISTGEDILPIDMEKIVHKRDNSREQINQTNNKKMELK